MCNTVCKLAKVCIPKFAGIYFIHFLKIQKE